MLDFAASTGLLTEAGEKYIPMSVARFGNPFLKAGTVIFTKFTGKKDNKTTTRNVLGIYRSINQ